MKKLLSLLIAAAITAGCALPAFAADSDKMKAALSSVKTRVDIPAELSVFRSGMNEFDGNIQYNFRWNSEDGNDSISVSADADGRISHYNRYINEKEEDYPLSSLTSEQARAMADEAIRSIAPELFANDADHLVFSEINGSASVSRKWFYISYVRELDGTPVAGNNASVNITAYGDTAYVSYADIEWDYDAKFAPEQGIAVDDPQASYLKVFPVELVYNRMYSRERPLVKLSDGREISPETVMMYSFAKDPGYILASDGSELIFKENDKYRSMSMKSMAAGAYNEAAADMGYFTDEELSELDKIENLISKDDALKYLRSLEGLKLSEDMKLSSSSISRYLPLYFRRVENKDPENEQFRMSMYITDGENSNAHAMLDAQNGELLSYSRWTNTDNSVIPSKVNAKAETDEFIKAVAQNKSAECTEPEINDQEHSYSVKMTRIVNGIPYRGNGINATYDKDFARISDYNIDWDEITEYFADPSEAIGLEAATKKIFEISPLRLVYVFDGEIYRLCYGTEKSHYLTNIDALTGEALNKEDVSSDIHYSDINGHWAQKAIECLAEINLLENTETFRPDDAVTASELTEMLNRSCSRYLRSDDIRNPDDAIMREDAFVLMIRSIGFERVAKLSGIFNCPFADSGEISADKLGYAAILTGFGVISGDAGSIRAKDNLTRAEAAMMIYKYLNYKG